MQDYMDLLRPSKKTKTDSLKRSSSSLSITHSVYSDQSPRESKSRQYSTTYELRLQAKGSHMYEYDSHCDADNRKKKEKIKQDCKSLLKRRAKHPQDTLFRDESFQQTCDKIRNRNEAIIVQDISRLIVPSAQNLAILGASRLSDLYETVNEGWNNIYPFEGTRPQPDYAVGFDACAFTQEQHRKLQHHIGQPGSNLLTCFLATPRMYFPFLTCEIKCGNEALDIADRQNAHSMTVAVRAVVLLFSLVKRLPEIHREILGFSISHNDSSVRIYGHYAVIRGENASYYRHTIRRFDFTDSDGLERWTAYDFTRNVYDIWKPLHFQRITSVLDSLPNHRTIGRVPSVSSPSTSFSQQTSNLDSQQLQADVEADGTQMLDLDPVLADMQTIASTTASSQLDGSQNGTSTTALTPKTESQSDAASRLVTQALKPKARKTGGRKSSNSKNPV